MSEPTSPDPQAVRAAAERILAGRIIRNMGGGVSLVESYSPDVQAVAKFALANCTESGESLAEQVSRLTAELASVTRERDALQAFKDYVHKRLDDAGVPVDPESSHKLEGCRIGGRLDIVLGAMSEREALAADRDRLDWLDKCADDWLEITCGKTKEAGAWKTHFSVCGKWGGKTASVTGDQASVRQAIDAARGEQAK